MKYDDKIAYFDGLGHRWDEVVGNDASRAERLRGVFGDIELRAGDRVLDVGCGNGVLFDHIEGRIGPDGALHAIDSAPAMIARARAMFARYGNITYHEGLLEEADIPETYFDCIVCFAVFPHFEDKPAAVARLRRLIAPDGRMYIFHLAGTDRLNEFHGGLDAPVSRDMMPDRDALERILGGAGFRMARYHDEPELNFIEARPC